MEHLKTVVADALAKEAAALSANGTHPLTAMFGRDETNAGGDYAIYVVFERPETHDTATLKAILPKNGALEFPSLTPAIPAAAWYEREIHDMFGIVPIGHPDLRPLVLHENFPQDFFPLRKATPADAKPVISTKHPARVYPMRTARGEGVFEVPVGPIHAGIIEPGHFRFSQAGEAMLQLDAKLFYTHRGLEKVMEGKTPHDALSIVERICGACSIANTWSFCQAIEKITGTVIPKRAAHIRTLLAEMERLINHVGDLGNIPAGVGFAPAISLGNRAKEHLMRLAEAVAGNRFLRGVIVPGGVSTDITPALTETIRKTLSQTAIDIDALTRMFAEQDSFQNRVRTTGIVRYRTAVDLALVGVGARASRFAHDSRKDFCYGSYPALTFRTVTEKSGDVAARLAVRIAESHESLRMIEQLLTLLNEETSPLCAPLEPLRAAGEDYGISESARGSDFHYVALASDGTIDRIFVRSASYANWPALPIAVQGDIIPDFPLINKSFELCYACLDR